MTSVVTALSLLLTLAPARDSLDSLTREQAEGALGARLDAQLQRFAEYGFWGTVLVAREGKIALLKGYGFADARRGVRNTPATRFEMNSITKTFTGAAILRLYAEGRLAPGDPVERLLGAFPAAKQGATIEHLARHTSGLIVKGIDLAGDTRAAFVQSAKNTPRESPPGEQYRYTNAGFSLLAAIIEITSGGTYEDYLRHQLFAPAGMRSACFRDEVGPEDSLYAHGYTGTPAKLEPGPPNPYVWGTRGAGGVWATVGDMYRWVTAIEEGRIVPDDQRRIMFTAPPPPAREAYGWHEETLPDGKLLIQKGGGSDDFASHLLYYPKERVLIIWATNNMRQRWRQTLNRTIPAIVFGGTSLSMPAVVQLPQPVLRGCAGYYFSAADTLEIRAAQEHLYAARNQLGVPTEVMFFPQGDGVFTGFDPQGAKVTRLIIRGSGSQSITVELADGRRFTAQR